MATRVSRSRIYVTSFNNPTPKKNLRDISYSIQVVCRHSIARSRKPPTRRKYLSDISHTSCVIAHFVLNVVAMATRVGHGSICVILFNSPTPKTPCWTQKSPIYLVYKRVIADFVSNFVTMATEVGRGKFVWRHSIARPQNPLLYAKISEISFM